MQFAPETDVHYVNIEINPNGAALSSVNVRRVPTYRHGEGAVLRGNLYKCGDETDHPHYACFHNIDWAKPDYHRPEFFATFVLG